MSHDHSIRTITIVEQADLAAQRAVETGEPQLNPHIEGTPEYRRWDVCYARLLQLRMAPEAEGSA
jgi:hypothetical protein